MGLGNSQVVCDGLRMNIGIFKILFFGSLEIGTSRQIDYIFAYHYEYTCFVIRCQCLFLSICACAQTQRGERQRETAILYVQGGKKQLLQVISD